jgi:hypothetical protein
MSYDDLGTLLDELAEEVGHLPQREFSAPAWARARRVRRRRAVLVAAAAVVLAAVPVATLVPGDDEPARPAAPGYSEAPVRGRAAHTATLLGDGRVLIVGGCTRDGCTTAEDSPGTEYYVPGRGFTAGPELVQPRQGHSATVLADGRVLIVGGWAREGASPMDSAEIYEPRAGTFIPVGPLASGRGGHTAAVLPDGRVLVAGGNSDTAELFDPERNEFSLAESMPEPRIAAPAITLADGRVLVVGGRDTAGRALASAVLYDPRSDTWQPTGSMGTPRDKHALAPLPDGRVLVLGGTRDEREPLATTEVYDPRTGRFESGPPMDTRRFKLTAAVDADGRVIVAGGTRAAVYDSDGFRPIGGTAGALRWYPTVTSLPNGDVLIVGGYDDNIRVHDDALLVSASQIAAATR